MRVIMVTSDESDYGKAYTGGAAPAQCAGTIFGLRTK
jgi:hypothetical protein